MTDGIVVCDYDPAWPELFEELASPIRAALPAAVVEHVGSTAVPGLAAKPIIDLDVVVRSPEDVGAAIDALRTLGYAHQGDLGVTGREAFRRPSGAAPHHVYVVVAESAPHRDHRDFRDRLRADAETARAYAELKRELADRYRDDRVAYSGAKSEFVESALAAARTRDDA